MTTPTTFCPTDKQPPLTKSYKMNLETDVNLTLTSYNCGNVLSVCVPESEKEKDKCKDVDPIIIWATDTTTKSKIMMYLPYVGNIVARKFTDAKVTYYGFVATQYVSETDIVEFDYDSKQLSITDSNGTKYTSALMNTPTTVEKILYSSFVLAPPILPITPTTQPYTSASVTFASTDTPPSPPDNKKKLSPLAILLICLGAILILFVILFIAGRGSRMSSSNISSSV